MKGIYDKPSVAKTIKRPERKMAEIGYKNRSTKQSSSRGVRGSVERNIQLRKNFQWPTFPWDIINRNLL